MPHRAVSPARSENEYDISSALVPHAADDSDDASSLEEEHEGRKGPKPHTSNKTRLDPAALAECIDVDGGDGDGEGGGDDDDDDYGFIAAQQAASNRKASNLKGRSVKKGGGFQAMGLNPTLLKAIARKGFSVPTPIQRKTVPLVLDGQDVVGMARTGSGKTAAFVIPLIEKLRAHSPKVGARALVLSPSRELALQTLKVVKELGRGTDLRCVLLVGGDSLEEQFAHVATNPDVIIATPGRFLHLRVEMELDLASVRYVVFDEADRLFEMGFAVQLTEILHALPLARQTLLFSATLPRSLVEFARAGLQAPQLVRLDAETKVSPDLESAFFTVKPVEKEAALLHLLTDVIKIPTGPPPQAAANSAAAAASAAGKKRKRDSDKAINSKESPTAHSTLVFTATKHHVEYMAALLRHVGFAVSHAYGSLDQAARRMQVQAFRSGLTNILVVTDVAARGIDIPILANVINYDFPSQAKIFVHRVGRTARAGKRGRSYSFVTMADAPYLLDLQLFLGRKLVMGGGDNPKSRQMDLTRDIVVGALARDQVEKSGELVTKLLDEDSDLAALHSVVLKGEKLYNRTRNPASAESVKRAKALITTKEWMALHQMFREQSNSFEDERESMLARVSKFRPQETIFEIGKRAQGNEAAEIMRKHREKIKRRKVTDIADEEKGTNQSGAAQKDVDADAMDLEDDSMNEQAETGPAADQLSADEEEIEVTFTQTTSRKKSEDGKGGAEWEDPEHFMSYTPAGINLAEEREYGVTSGVSSARSTNFMEAARGATVDLATDEAGGSTFGAPGRARAAGGFRWDKKGKKYVARANDEDGSKGAKMIKSESGQKIPASFRSGRFDAWRRSNKIGRLARTGELESPSLSRAAMSIKANPAAGSGGDGDDAGGTGGGPHTSRRFKHRQERAPKDADKFRDDYHQRKRRVEEARQKRVGRFRFGDGRKELRSVDEVRKERRIQEGRKSKNARPSSSSTAGARASGGAKRKSAGKSGRRK